MPRGHHQIFRDASVSARCSVDGCDNTRAVKRTGYCSMHQQRFLHYGDPSIVHDSNAVRWAEHVHVDKVCAAPDCDILTKDSATYCSKHYTRLRNRGELEPVDGRVYSNQARQNTADTFWNKLNKNGPWCEKRQSTCWVFPTSDPKEYGVVRYQGATWRAHRLAFFLTNGYDAKRFVCHHCDNPPCCNPDHLYDGDDSSNMQDMWDRDRHPRPTGAAHHNAKVTAEQELEITAKYNALGDTGRWNPLGSVQDIADEYGIDRKTVRRIARRVNEREGD
jgi:hypothetical protein